jgi:galactonate dehydratase
MPDYLDSETAFDPVDGYLQIPDGPGLGITLNETKLRNADPPDWKNPVWRYEDGSIAEW